jgi:hypothetical protein
MLRTHHQHPLWGRKRKEKRKKKKSTNETKKFKHAESTTLPYYLLLNRIHIRKISKLV